MVVVILQLLVVLYTGLMILQEVISLNCTNVIALLMSPNTMYFANRIVNAWNNLPDTVVTAPSSLSFRRQLAKFDLSSFCVNF